jgi:Toprim domain
VIPEGVKRLKIYCDGDSSRFDEKTGRMMPSPGEAAGRALAEKARAQGVEADVILPPVNSDWNDVWMSVRGSK